LSSRGASSSSVPPPEALAPSALDCRQAGGAQSPCQAVFGYGGCDDIRDVYEGLAVVPDADADRGGFHGLDVVIGVADRHGVRQGNTDVLADCLDAHRLGQAGREDLEGNVPRRAHGADDRPIALRQRRRHRLHRRIAGRHVGRHLRERTGVDIHDEGSDRLGVLDPVLGVCARPWHKEVEVPLGGPHLVRALPHVKSIEVLPQGGEDSDVLGGHALVQQDAISHRHVPSRPGDDALKTQVDESRVDLGDGPSRAHEQAVTALPHPTQRPNRRIGDPLARIAQRPVDVNEDRAGRAGLVSRLRGSIGVRHRAILSQGRNGLGYAEHAE